ncbi:MAG: GNAT family N-acetyltransferase [Allorhizobium sp.]
MNQTDDITIRPARPDDVETLHRAILSLAAHLGAADKVTSTVGDLLAHGFRTQPAFEGLIAEVDGVFAGMCLTLPNFSTWRGRMGVYVQDLFVEDAFRGKKIGEALLKVAARRGRERGAEYLRLSVDVENVAAQGFYARLGIAHARDEQIHMIRGEAFLAFATDGEEQP